MAHPYLIGGLLTLCASTAFADPSIRLRSTAGDLFINLTPDAAPNTVANFLDYVDNGDFINAFFHESQTGENGGPRTLSAGQFRWSPGSFVGRSNVRTGPTIDNEFNQSNARGTVAMVREAGDPNSATNSWFINVADNGGVAPNGLDFVDGGATVFGTISESSMQVVDNIAALAIEDQGRDLPLLPVLTATAANLRRDQVVLFESITEFAATSRPASAVLPLSRSISSTGSASAFATIVNSGDTIAASCRIQPSTTIAADFSYRETDPVTNVAVGEENPLLDIAANDLATLVFSFTPTAAFDSTLIEFEFNCGNATAAAATTIGVNTFVLSALDTPSADMVALAGTIGNTGITDIPAGTDSGAFVVATSNLGSAEVITASANTGDVNLPVSLFVCPTNPATGQCQIDPAVTVEATQAAGGTATYAIFAQLTQTGSGIPFDPAVNRAFVEFRSADGSLRGSTSVALRTVP